MDNLDFKQIRLNYENLKPHISTYDEATEKRMWKEQHDAAVFGDSDEPPEDAVPIDEMPYNYDAVSKNVTEEDYNPPIQEIYDNIRQDTPVYENPDNFYYEDSDKELIQQNKDFQK